LLFQKKQREEKIKDLEAVIAQGGVKAMATKAELEKLTHLNESDMNHLEAKIKASTKKSEVLAEKMLAEKEAARAATDADSKTGSRGKLAERQAAFGN